MNNLPLVSAVICSRDGHERIARAIRSVLTQDYPRLELIVLDDGSVKSLNPIISSIHDSRIHFIALDQNRGLHAARAIAVGQAKGEFIALLDDDDEWLPGKLTKQISLLLESPDIGMICGGASDIYPDGSIMLRLPPSHKITHAQEIVNEWTIASSVIFRKSAYDQVGGFDGSLRRCGDWECWIRLSKNYEIKSVMEPVVITYMRKGSLQRSGDIEAYEQDRWKVILKHEDEIRQMGLWDLALYYQYHSIGIRYLRSKQFSKARAFLCNALKHHMSPYSAFALLLSIMRVRNDMVFRKIARYLKKKRQL